MTRFSSSTFECQVLPAETPAYTAKPVTRRERSRVKQEEKRGRLPKETSKSFICFLITIIIIIVEQSYPSQGKEVANPAIYLSKQH